MISEKVKMILSEILEVNLKDIEMESNLEDDLGADSLDKVEIVMKLEDEFDIVIDEENQSKMKKVKDIVKYIETKVFIVN